MSYLDILRVPDAVTVFSEAGPLTLDQAGGAGVWQGHEIEVRTRPDAGILPVVVTAPRSALRRIHLRWQCSMPAHMRVLGDHWERGYGDLEWRGLVPERILPWYFLTHDGRSTQAYGVRTGAHSLCFWQVDPAGVSLWLDVRCGDRGVQLGERLLEAATVVARQGGGEETAFAAATAFCRMLCDRPRMPRLPLYGGNNWYYAYGNSSHRHILEDARAIASLAPQGENRPFMVIDDGWQINGPICSGGPWRYSNGAFPDMPRLAAEMTALGARPGIWVRPLLTAERLPGGWFLPSRAGSAGPVLDPTVPEARALIAADIRRLAEWGYELIKHDFTTYDLFGRWGFEMGAELTSGGWAFSDRGRTTAEVLLDLYRTIREAAGEALVMGCNTVGHLAAGSVDVQRTGDDTSGRAWERTRKMGVNTLAFRMPQHGTFFAADADCVGLTRHVPWDLNRQWLDLLARSGTPLFVSASPDALGPEQREALKSAFALAAQEQPAGEPLDWLETTCPSAWRLRGEERAYRWLGAGGTDPFSA